MVQDYTMMNNSMKWRRFIVPIKVEHSYEHLVLNTCNIEINIMQHKWNANEFILNHNKMITPCRVNTIDICPREVHVN
jgi:hypothetical protein